MTLLSNSGGLFWHAKALLRSNGAWADFRRRVKNFLSDWHDALQNQEGHAMSGMILIGPSGGWCLPKIGFLECFPELICIDPDASAKVVFNRRHRASRCPAQARTWIHSTHQLVLPDLLKRHPHHAVLFCNVLGQLRYNENRTIEEIEFELNQLKFILQGRHWASFHDRISGKGLIRWVVEREFLESRAISNQNLVRRVASTGEWLDHLTEKVLPSANHRRLICWPISQRRLHWIEAGWVRPEDQLND